MLAYLLLTIDNILKVTIFLKFGAPRNVPPLEVSLPAHPPRRHFVEV